MGGGGASAKDQAEHALVGGENVENVCDFALNQNCSSIFSGAMLSNVAETIAKLHQSCL